MPDSLDTIAELMAVELATLETMRNSVAQGCAKMDTSLKPETMTGQQTADWILEAVDARIALQGDLYV